MQQVLEANQIPNRIVDLGIGSCLGTGSPTALQVHPEDRWTALLLLSSVEEESESDLE